MSSRVSPNDCSVRGVQEMSISVSAQPEANRVSQSFVVTIPEEENFNEQLLKKIYDVYSPVLKLMKLFGIYFGGTSLKRFVSSSGRYRKQNCLSRIYCAVAISGVWFNFIMTFAAIFVGGKIYLFLMYSLWQLLMALNGTICLVTLAITKTSNSRFEIFLTALSAVKNVNLEKVKTHSKRGLIFFGCYFLTTVSGIVAGEVLLHVNPGTLKPWNHWSGFKILHPVFLAIGTAAWLLPILFVCITCSVLEELFDDLHKRMLSLGSISVDLAALKREYHKLCNIVEVADKMIAPQLFGIFSVFIPLLCFCFYNIVNVPEGEGSLFLFSNLFWMLIAVAILAIISLFGSKVSEKVWHKKLSFPLCIYLFVCLIDYLVIYLLTFGLSCSSYQMFFTNGSVLLHYHAIIRTA